MVDEPSVFEPLKFLLYVVLSETEWVYSAEIIKPNVIVATEYVLLSVSRNKFCHRRNDVGKLKNTFDTDYSGTSVARILTTRLSRLFRTRS